jgi:hypothetical protein
VTGAHVTMIRPTEESLGQADKRKESYTPVRMALDALIAVSARRHKAIVVTADWSDFEAIRYYCDVRVIKASDYFKR